MDAVPKASLDLHRADFTSPDRDTRTHSVGKYEQEILRTDVDKSCSEPEIHVSKEFNPVVVLYDIALNKGGVKIDADKSYSKLEVHIFDELNSAVEQRKSRRRRQSAVGNNISNTNESSDELEWPSSDSSDEGEKTPLDSSDELEWLFAGDTSNDSGDSSDSSYNNEVVSKKKVTVRKKAAARQKKNKEPEIKELSEYEKKIQEKRNEKLAFLQSLRMDEVKEDLSQAIRNLKPKRIIKTEWPKDPTRKSVRLANVHVNYSETKILGQIFGIEEEIKKGKEDPNKVAYNPKRRWSSREIGFEGSDSSTFESRRLAQVKIDLYEEKLLTRALAAIKKEFQENEMKRKIALDESRVKEDPTEVLWNPTPTLSSREISFEGPESSTCGSRPLAKVNFDLSEEALLARALATVRKEFQEVKDVLNEDTANLKLESEHRKRERERIKRPNSSICESLQLAKVDIDLNEEELLAKALDAIRKEFEENKMKRKAETMVEDDPNESLRNPTPALSSEEMNCQRPESSTRKSLRLKKVNIDLSDEALLARVLAAVRKEFKENKKKRKIEFKVKEDLNRNQSPALPSREISCQGPEISPRKSCRLAKVNVDLSEEALLRRALAAIRKEYKENKMKTKTESMK